MKLDRILPAMLAIGLMAPDARSQYTGGPSSEYQLLRNLVTSNGGAGLTIWNCQGAAPDPCGMVSSNSYFNAGNETTGNIASGAFSADEQRLATDSILVGVTLYGTGIISNDLCDKYVAQGMAAINAAYAMQIPGTPAPSSPDGSFYTTLSETYPGGGIYAYTGAATTVTGAGSPSTNSSDNMPLFLAYSNHALLLLTQSAHYYGSASSQGLYYQSVQNLLPKMENALDYLYLIGVSGGVYAGNQGGLGLTADVLVPNRSMMIACAFRLGQIMFQTLGAGSSGDLADWQTAAQWWLNNVFVSCPYFSTLANPRPLFDQNSGAFYEGGISAAGGGPGNPGFSYDASYQALATRFLYYYAAEAPADLPNLNKVVSSSGRFFERRVLPQGLYLDATANSRTGPTGGYPENAMTAFDNVSARWALLYYDLLVNNIVDGGTGTQTDGVVATERMSTIAATPSLPPVIVNSAASLADVIIPTGTAFTATNPAFRLYANNAGEMGVDTATLDPNFAINISGTMPSGLSFGSPMSYTQGTGNGDQGYIDQSVAWVPLTGTATATGTYTVTATPQNSPYVYTFSNSPPYYSGQSADTPSTNLYSPPVVSGGSTAQQGSAVSVTFNVYNTNTSTATNDAYVRDGSYASTNFGTAATMPVRLATTSGFNRIAYAMFTPGTISGTIYKAYLRLYGDYGTDATYEFSNIQCYGIPNTSWTQSTITWNNQPGLSSGTLLSISTVYQVFPGFPEQYYQWDVTSWVMGHSGTVSFALAQAAALLGDANFNSTNFASNPPQLVIYYR